MKEMNIALAADSNYMIPIMVTLQSIFTHHNNINVYLCFLEENLKEEDINTLSQFTELNNSNLYPLKISYEQLHNLPDTRHGKTTLLRLYLPQLLPNINKILYLDGDIVINDKLSELYNIDLENNYIAASKDTAPLYHPDRIRDLEISNTHWYFNAGITLMNLEALRKIDLSKKIHDYAKRHFNQITSPDQDVLNYICQGHTIYIHPRYNMNYNVEKDVAISTWGKEQVKEAKQSPAIIHYIGPIKPWHILCTHPQRKLWWNMLQLTKYKDFKPKDANLKNYIKKYYLQCVRNIEKHFTLKSKQSFGKLIPTSLKKRIKKSLMK